MAPVGVICDDHAQTSGPSAANTPTTTMAVTTAPSIDSTESGILLSCGFLLMPSHGCDASHICAAALGLALKRPSNLTIKRGKFLFY